MIILLHSSEPNMAAILFVEQEFSSIYLLQVELESPNY